MATKKQIGYGSQGSDVTELQKLLNSSGYNLKEDGIYGDKTMAAVKDYQTKNNLSVDGIVGNDTWGALTGTKATQPYPSTGATQPPLSNGTATTHHASTMPDVSGFTYDPFKVSDSTAEADKYRKDVAAQKPGEFSYGAYEKSDIVKQAEALLQQQLANKPGEYQSAWQATLDETLQKILNREKFSYDLNGDALYQQYKDQYMLQGQQAMMDTMGQAAAMTGGYGNSYAQTVGQQTYQGHLQQLNDRVPELYQLALNQYNREGDEMYNQYAMFADRENQDYGRYRDALADYNTELGRLTDEARYQSETDYGKFMDAYNMAYGQHRDQVSDWQHEQARADEDYWNQYSRDYGQYSDNRDFSYGQHRDQMSDSQWEQAFKYQTEQDRIAQEQWQKEFEEAQRQFNIANDVDTGSGSGGSGGGGSTGGGGGSYDPAIAQRQETLRKAGYNVVVDGIDGPQTQGAWAEYQNYLKATDPSYRAPVVTPSTGGNGGGFNGSTYSEATAYLKEHGQSTGGLMTQSEWQRHKNGNNSAGGEHEASSYQEYLAAYIYGKTK